MKTINIGKFKKVLEATVIELDPTAQQRDAILVEQTADDLDRTLRASERELAVHALEVGSVKRREARAALHRIREGSYGICIDCDSPISRARLAALPWAALCIRCQEAEDQCTRKYVGVALPMAA